MTKNYKVRLIVSFSLLFLAFVCIFTLESIPFKVIFTLFSAFAAFELMSFFKRKCTLSSTICAILQLAFLVGGCIFVSKIDAVGIILLIFSVCAYDSFAYIFGNALGGRIFKKSRPFPFVSKNKTWEGTIMGLITSVFFTGAILLITNSDQYIFFAGGILGLIGDLFESFTKRRFDVKDSNEIIIKNKFAAIAEMMVGGSEGHGGFLDRFDSLTFAGTILLLISLI